MSDDSSVHQGKNEIIIVRRRGGGDDGHHGGAWKIAYADFMTAMMAFFLVMWLVNAANEETKAAVASYFNPIKLTDESPSERGIKQVGSSADGQQTAPKSIEEGVDGSLGQDAKSGEDSSATVGDKAAYSEADYFKDPYAVLAEIAKETGTKSNISETGDGGAANSGPASGANGGEAYRDPFDPDFWSKQTKVEQDIIAESQASLQEQLEAEKKAQEDVAAAAKLATTGAEADSKSEIEAEQAKQTELGLAMGAAEGDKAGNEGEKAKKRARELESEIGKALDGAAIGKLAEGLSVEPAEGGLLVSLTDQFEFEMFRIGSAVPERALVLAMAKIGEVLSKKNGSVSIRGHTDARPFSNGTDDNWRLSMERAHSAFFMLARGGLAEERIVQLSGFAERKLRDKENPFAEVNRRIEILIQSDGG